MTTQRAPNSKRQRIYLLEDVAAHAKLTDLWVVHDNKIYDVTKFASDHPGGDELILAYAGKDITSIMSDPQEHSHSTSAFELLQEYQVGRLGSEETITNPDFVWEDHFVPKDTDNDHDWEKNQFLDLNKPLVPQMLRSEFSKAFYLQQVHQPRHLPGSANLLGPWYLEMFTKTQWYIVPLIWVPIFAYLFYRSFEDLSRAGVPFSDALTRAGLCFLAGNAIWTIIEYGMHRWIFHMEEYLPDHSLALSAHFLLHGIHHYLPMDGLRLVMPPILFTALQYPFTQLAYKLFPVWMANGVISGAFAFYVVYDCFHYAMHHMKLPKVAAGQKSWHMEHHYKEPNLGFGVSSPIWDWVFGTEFVSRPKTVGK